MKEEVQKNKNSYTLSFQEIDKTMLALVGGKGANLGELSRIEGISVPEGFCVTTEAYKSVIKQTPEFSALLDQLTLLTVDEVESVREICGKIRVRVEATPIAKDIEKAVADLSDAERIRPSYGPTLRRHSEDDFSSRRGNHVYCGSSHVEQEDRVHRFEFRTWRGLSVGLGER